MGPSLDAVGWKHEGNNQSIETRRSSKDKDKDHAHKQPRLQCHATDSSVTYDADGKASSQTAEPYRETSSQEKEGPGGR